MPIRALDDNRTQQVQLRQHLVCLGKGKDDEGEIRNGFANESQ